MQKEDITLHTNIQTLKGFICTCDFHGENALCVSTYMRRDIAAKTHRAVCVMALRHASQIQLSTACTYLHIRVQVSLYYYIRNVLGIFTT